MRLIFIFAKTKQYLNIRVSNQSDTLLVEGMLVTIVLFEYVLLGSVTIENRQFLDPTVSPLRCGLKEIFGSRCSGIYRRYLLKVYITNFSLLILNQYFWVIFYNIFNMIGKIMICWKQSWSKETFRKLTLGSVSYLP